jgi:hypothetical protein
LILGDANHLFTRWKFRQTGLALNCLIARAKTLLSNCLIASGIMLQEGKWNETNARSLSGWIAKDRNARIFENLYSDMQ